MRQRKDQKKNLDITDRCKKGRGGRYLRRLKCEACSRPVDVETSQTTEYDFNYELILCARAKERRHTIGKELLEISSEIKKVKEGERGKGRNTPLSLGRSTSGRNASGRWKPRGSARRSFHARIRLQGRAAPRSGATASTSHARSI